MVDCAPLRLLTEWIFHPTESNPFAPIYSLRQKVYSLVKFHLFAPVNLLSADFGGCADQPAGQRFRGADHAVGAAAADVLARGDAV